MKSNCQKHELLKEKVEMLFLSPQRSENKAEVVKQRTAGLRYGVASHLNSNEIPFFVLSYYFFFSVSDLRMIGKG